MSQFFVETSALSPVIPPTVPTSFPTDINSPAIPAANTLNVFGGSVSTNNLLGIQTDGGSGSSTLTIELTNRIQGFISTPDATPATIVNFPLGATPGVYLFEGNIQAFDTTDNAGFSGDFKSCIRTTGAAGVIIGTDLFDEFSEAATAALTFTITSPANNLLIQVTGKAATAIDWRAFVTYRFVG